MKFKKGDMVWTDTDFGIMEVEIIGTDNPIAKFNGHDVKHDTVYELQSLDDSIDDWWDFQPATELFQTKQQAIDYFGG